MMHKTDPETALGIGVMLMISLLVLGCTPNMESMGNTDSPAKEGSMNLESNIERNTVAIPAMDAAAPAVFETASFGLG